MKSFRIKPGFILALFFVLISVSCEYGQRAEEQLSEFNAKAGELDALINQGIEKVNDLDSLLPETSKNLKRADSIFNNASSTLDSLNQRVEKIQNIFN